MVISTNIIQNKENKLSGKDILKTQKADIIELFSADTVINAYEDGFKKGLHDGLNKREKEILEKISRNKLKKIETNVLAYLKVLQKIYNIVEENKAKSDVTNFSFLRLDKENYKFEIIIPLNEAIYNNIDCYESIYNEVTQIIYELDFIRNFSFIPYDRDNIDLESLEHDCFIKI